MNVSVPMSASSGVVFCAGFEPSTIITSVYQVKAQNFYQYSGNALSSYLSVSVRGLEPTSTYDIYCYFETLLGVGISQIETIHTRTTVTTKCCKMVLFTYVSKYIVLNNQKALLSAPALEIELDFRPSLLLNIRPVFHLTNGSLASYMKSHPAVLSYNNHSSLSGSFLVCCVPGTYIISLELYGPDQYGYLSPVPTTVIVVASDNKYISIFPPPALTSATFGYSGTYVIVSYSTETDKGSLGDASWPCTQLFTFVGSSDCSCTWTDNQSVRITFPQDRGQSMLLPGGTIYSKGGVLRQMCDSTLCHQYTAANISSINTTTQNYVVSPVVIIMAPSYITAKNDLPLSTAFTTGNAARSWVTWIWSITASNGANTSAITSYLKAFKISTSIAIPYKLLQSHTTYTITLYVKNYLGRDGAQSIRVSVWDVHYLLPSVFIVGQPSVVRPSSSFTLSAVTSYTNDTYFSLKRIYTWTVYNYSDVTPWLSITSTSKDPKSFGIATYTLSSGQTYRFFVEVHFFGLTNDLHIVVNATAIVYVLPAFVTATIYGGTYRVINSLQPLILDASHSSDGESDITKLQRLRYSWSCKVMSGLFYQSPCDGLFIGPRSTAIGIANSTEMIVNVTYLFTVLVTSLDSQSFDYANVTAIVGYLRLANIEITTISGLKINRNDKLKLQALVQCKEAAAIGAWTLSPTSTSTFQLKNSSLSPTVITFRYADIATPVAYPLSISAYSMEEGHTYTFRLTVSARDGNAFHESVYSEISVTIRVPPSHGNLLVNPWYGEFVQRRRSSSGAVFQPLSHRMFRVFSRG